MPPLAYLLLLLAAVAVVLLIVIAAAGGSSEEPEATQPSSVAPSEEPSVEMKPIPAGWVQIDPSVLDGSVGDLALVNAQYGIEPGSSARRSLQKVHLRTKRCRRGPSTEVSRMP